MKQYLLSLLTNEFHHELKKQDSSYKRLQTENSYIENQVLRRTLSKSQSKPSLPFQPRNLKQFFHYFYFMDV